MKKEIYVSVYRAIARMLELWVLFSSRASGRGTIFPLAHNLHLWVVKKKYCEIKTVKKEMRIEHLLREMRIEQLAQKKIF